MCRTIFLIVLLVSSSYSQLFGIEKLRSYINLLNNGDFYPNTTSNELWRGILKDCSKKTSFSCIQKNVYTYLDDTFEDRDNVTVFDGFILTKNNLDYHKYSKKYNAEHDINGENVVDETNSENDEKERFGKKETVGKDRSFNDNYVESLSPLEEVTTALQDKAVKFLVTRDYEVQLPNFFFEGANIKVSPKEIDDSGALVRIDFKQRSLENDGRFFKKIKKFIGGKLLVSFLALLLIIKLIKVKFMFIIPFLFGVGTAKKLFLKLLLFLVPAFAHIFKLCSSYYSSGTKYHHHHHQIAHHHHHVPVPVPIPAYHDHPHHHHHDSHEDDSFDGFDYTQPHIQYRKDIEELKEWGIEPNDAQDYSGPYSQTVPSVGPYGMSQYAPNARPVNSVPNYLDSYENFGSQYDKPVNIRDTPDPNIQQTLSNIGVAQFNRNPYSSGNQAQYLAYNGYLDDGRFTRAATPVTESTSRKRLQQHVVPQTLGFRSKSDVPNNWAQGPKTNSNVLRPEQVAKPSVKNMMFVQSTQGNTAGRNQAQTPNLGQVVQVLPPVLQNAQTATPNTQNGFQNGRNNQKDPKVQNLPLTQQKVGQNFQTSPVFQKNTNVADNRKIESGPVNNQGTVYDDKFYGPILKKLEEIFTQLRFTDEGCRERLICSMYKNPTIFTPHSNIVSNELSRDPEELKQGDATSLSGRRFQRYTNAARSGQDGGDCLRLYPCHIKTE